MTYETLYALYEAMSELIEKYTTHYKSDFYYYDMRNLIERENRNDEYKVHWLIRSTGTWLLNGDDYDILEYARGESDFEFIITRNKYGEYYMEKQ